MDSRLFSLVEILDCIITLKALGEESRMHLMRHLLHHPSTVNELSEHLQISQYNVSKHLKVLRDAGLVLSEKQGVQRRYRITPQVLQQLNSDDKTLELGCCTFRFGSVET